MASKIYRATAHFPEADGAIISAATEAANWPIALGRVARELKKNPLLKRKRITSISITMIMVGNGERDSQGQGQSNQSNIERLQTVEPNLLTPSEPITNEPTE